MEHTQAIAQLQQEIENKKQELARIIDPMEERLTELQEQEIQQKLNDNNRCIVCVDVTMTGMNNAYGTHHSRHSWTTVQQQQIFTFMVPREGDGSDKLRICLQDDYNDQGHERDVFISIYPGESYREDSDYIAPSATHNSTFDFLFFYEDDPDATSEPDSDDCDKIKETFGDNAPMVWNHLMLLNDKKQSFPFTY